MTAPVSRGPIDAIDALERVEAELLALLSNLTPDEWDAPTIVRGWHVRHIAGHLLDTATRKLTILRDGFGVERPASDAPADVRDFVNRLNAEGALVYGRLSLDVVRLLMAHVSAVYCAWHRALDPAAPAGFAVSWAGETQSANWFDTARELTERWHHQAQIRLALRRPPLDSRALYHPVLDCFMRVLPHSYRLVDAPPGTVVSVRVDGPASDDWQLVRSPGGWLLTGGLDGTPDAAVTVPGNIAWRMFTKSIERSELERQVVIEGDRSLALPALDSVAIVG
ncbi:MAG: maleylpyruvate isomerase family mycothiol-dependent enzyme [Acidobacteria bacterium]|nr:maleylpyruvate isomerase family mycothiol-dependent enzyme [Acidobacteriota bacterium]